MGRVIAFEEFLSSPLEVIECRTYRGPHLYSRMPMIRIQVNLGALEEWPSNRLPNFVDRLLHLLPSLGEHTCSTGNVGGFVSRLKEGTWLGHVVEHVAIELQTMAGMDVTRGKTRSVKGKPGQYNIMYSYLYEEAGRLAGRIALDLVASLLDPPFVPFKNVDIVHAFAKKSAFDLGESLAELKRLAKKEQLGPTTQALVDEAKRRRIPWFRLNDHHLIQLGTGRHRKLIQAGVTSATSIIAVETASNKELTKSLLANMGIPVPRGEAVRTGAGAVEAAQKIGFPVAVKPLDANHGRGVSTNLRAPEEVLLAFKYASEHSCDVIVERHFDGHDYRILVVNGEVVAAAERVPAHITGNGIDTIETLINKVNADPRRGEGHENSMTRIDINDRLKTRLASSHFTLESVPAKNQYVSLTSTANLSTGGTAIDRTDDIHPDNVCMACRAALTVGLDIAGIDMILPDIGCSWHESDGGIIEVNASPGFRMHLEPAEGKPRDVAKYVLSSLFPAGSKSRVPMIAITGTNGKSTTVRMVAHILRQAGMRVGFTSTSGIYVDDECIWSGDASGPESAQKLLQDPTIDMAILETARGGIVREGLGVMEVDVGVVLNVTGDHLGIGGIDTIEDLAAVKSVVAEAVVKDGVSVLNADDPRTVGMAECAGGKVCYFSSSGGKTGVLFEHVEKNGYAVTQERVGDRMHIVIYRDGKRIPVIATNDIPATHLGAAAFNIENALAATAVASGLGIDSYILRNALASFTSSYEQNPGRFNIYDAYGFRIIIDYAHNPAALRALFSAIQDMRSNYLRVIGNISIPGDRRDEDIREAGLIASRELDIVVFSEEPDLRGRTPGEVHKLLMEGACSIDYLKEQTICVRHEREAVEACLRMAQPGDIVMLMSGDPEGTWKLVRDFKPQSMERSLQDSKEQVAYV